MHIHGNALGVQGANFDSVANGERAAQARRSAEVRKRLLKAGAGGPDDLSPEEMLMIGQWLDGRHGEAQNGGAEPAPDPRDGF